MVYIHLHNVTFNEDTQVIGCDSLPTTTYDVEVDVIPFGVH